MVVVVISVSNFHSFSFFWQNLDIIEAPAVFSFGKTSTFFKQLQAGGYEGGSVCELRPMNLRWMEESLDFLGFTQNFLTPGVSSHPKDAQRPNNSCAVVRFHTLNPKQVLVALWLIA